MGDNGLPLSRNADCGPWGPSVGITLTWKDLSVYALTKEQRFFRSARTSYKRIVNNVCGAVKPGSLVAIMGGSGSGKTTLMSALAFRSPTGMLLEGHVRVNGRSVGPFMHRLSGFMHQEDLFVGSLTVREHLSFMARLRLDRRTSASERRRQVSELLLQLGLTKNADTRIGCMGNDKTLSGGEKKRLSFATEMLTDPQLLFCDEPTTGLDSYSAQKLVHMMKAMAGAGKTVICTIHQPSSEIFDMFHQLVLVADGRVAFIGDKRAALDFFARDSGCLGQFNPQEMAAHLSKCLSQLLFDCRVRKGPKYFGNGYAEHKCTWRGTKENLVKHVEASHPKLFSCRSRTEVRFQISGALENHIRMIESGGCYFWFVFFYCPRTRKDDYLLTYVSQGFRCPASYNPADFFIRTLATLPGAEESSRLAVRRICDRFAVSDAANEVDLAVQQEMHSSASYDESRDVTKKQQDFRSPFWITKLLLLTYRSILQVVRDPSVQALRIVQKMAIALTAGLCYLGTVTLTQDGVQSVQGALFIFVTENTFSPMYSVLAMFPLEIPLFMREHRSGLYSAQLYYVSKMAAMLPGLIVEPVLFIMIAYWLAGLRHSFYAFSMTALVATLTMNVSTACGIFFSNAFGSVTIAMAYLVPFDYVLMITSGLFIKLSTLPGYVAWTQYFSWLMYSNEALSILQWDGRQNITCGSQDPDLPCLTDGEQVLDKYSFSTDNFQRDIWAMLGLYFVFHLLGYLCLWRRAKK